MLRITDPAAALVARIAKARGCPAVVRVRVLGGGCMGLTWDLTIGDETPRPGDLSRDTGTVRVLVDPVSAGYLEGAAVDVGPFLENGLREPTQGAAPARDLVIIDLPARAERCECGQSFAPRD